MILKRTHLTNYIYLLNKKINQKTSHQIRNRNSHNLKIYEGHLVYNLKSQYF